MTPDAYTTYHAHCLSRGQTPPSREWWDRSLEEAKARKIQQRINAILQPESNADVQFDVDTERREGWVGL